MVVGRDHAGPGLDSKGRPFYPPYASQELGVGMIPFREMAYLPDEERNEKITRVPSNASTASISGTQVHEEFLARGKTLPGWFTRAKLAEILDKSYPPKYRRGVCVWFTGLSGSGKSTTAEVLTGWRQEAGPQVILLDGDVVRRHLSKGPGFSRRDRDTNIRRIGYVAAEIVREGGVAVCAAVSPYRDT